MITTEEGESIMSIFTPRRETAEPSDPFDTSIKHLLENVFKENNHDGPMALAFKEAEITTITKFLSLDKDDINELEFENSEGRTKKLSLDMQEAQRSCGMGKS